MPTKSFSEKMKERWLGVRIAEEAIEAADKREVLKIGRAIVSSHNKTFLDNYDEAESETVGNIHVGDVVNPPPPTQSGMGKGLLVALLMSGLIGAGGIGYFLPQFLSRLASSPSPPSSSKNYELGLGEPDEVPQRQRQD
jgi:hypothetical protein